MKPKSIVFILAAAVTALAVLLLAGCHEGRNGKKTPVEQKEVKADTNEADTMEAFYERMRHWEVLHGGMSRRESDK
jgi:hypothetical protein